MKVFLSWSGPQSQALAQRLHSWLPELLQFVEPWMSSEDIAKGSRWLNGITTELEVVRFGIPCITPANFSSPWLCFEAGAMSFAKGIGPQHVAPLLFGLTPNQVVGPLSHFQATTFNRAEMRKLADTMNSASGNTSVDSARLDKQFERLWPELQTAVQEILAAPDQATPKRDPDDVLEEILGGVRSLLRDQARLAEKITEQTVSSAWRSGSWASVGSKGRGKDSEPDEFVATLEKLDRQSIGPTVSVAYPAQVKPDTREPQN